MCYDIQAKLETQLKRARRLNQVEVIRELETELEPYLTNWHHVSGFTHPNLLIYTNETPNLPTVASWGLIPDWVKSKNQADDLRRKTVNARGESIFEKPSFRKSAQYHRCLICVDGFYEHHHRNGKIFPFFIKNKNGEPITLAGLWSNWTNRQTGEILKTFTIVTVKANPLMTEIHNNPKLKEARMPLILTNDNSESWINAFPNSKGMDEIKSIIKPSQVNLIAHTVRPLRGKHSVENSPKASEEFHYNDFNSLF
ncbi:SOS response-associated peptidase [Marinifilum breve]|uniref:Abasic site processing protein n=1 Tax=Marinifilum breve TaxID=2184082 RepID=A0A2V4A2X4_9BACT|nr:SOS response-associated peptidase [Marinifilum breve]PXY02878.1 SOS response-associated peptidase [Marinifilum breve]